MSRPNFQFTAADPRMELATKISALRTSIDSFLLEVSQKFSKPTKEKFKKFKELLNSDLEAAKAQLNGFARSVGPDEELALNILLELNQLQVKIKNCDAGELVKIQRQVEDLDDRFWQEPMIKLAMVKRNSDLKEMRPDMLKHPKDSKHPNPHFNSLLYTKEQFDSFLAITATIKAALVWIYERGPKLADKQEYKNRFKQVMQLFAEWQKLNDCYISPIDQQRLTHVGPGGKKPVYSKKEQIKADPDVIRLTKEFELLRSKLAKKLGPTQATSTAKPAEPTRLAKK